jgi:ATP-dependent helicase/nuclease subunit A
VAWRGKTEHAPPAITAAEAARRALVRKENRRLLYVALTRAQRWLIVCGAGPALTPGAGESWHALVADAMAALGAAREPEAGGDRLLLTHNWTEGAVSAREGACPRTAPPAWARTAPPRPPAAVPTMSPSALGGELALAAEALAGGLSPEAAKARGTALHRLLEHLHGRPAAERARLAARLLPGAAELPELLAEAAAVLDAPELGFLFGPGSLAEVDVTAPLPGGRLLGRIDRLVVEADRVLAVDFKSNRAVPASAGAVPEGILRQLGAYRAALRLIWRGRKVETAVLWTRAGRLMLVPDALADAAFARLAHLDREGAGS